MFSRFDVTVVERFPDLSVTSLQIDLRGHGIEAMRRMGIESAIRAKGVHETGLELVDTTGRRWAYIPANTSRKGAQDFTSEFEILRGDLCHIFYNRAKDKVKYKFGTYVTSYTDEEGSPVVVQFADGTSGEV